LLRTRAMKEAVVDRALGQLVPETFGERVWFFFSLVPLKQYRWYRQLLGGPWMLLWIDSPVNGFAWVPDDGKPWPLSTRLGRETWP
jgi:hypothetical protein